MTNAESHLKPSPLFDPESLAQAITQARQAKGIGLSALARSTGLARETLYRLERGQDVQISSLFAVAGALGLQLQLAPPQPPSLEEAAAYFGTQQLRP